MLFRQFVDDDLGCASYLIGDEEAGEAVLVDPAYDVDPYLEAAAAGGVHLTRVLETHTHADHVSGHGRLALEHGLRVCVHPASGATYPFDPIEDGDEIEVGSFSLCVLHTPGHRPEHCSFVAGDAVLTGDSLFVGAIARPDLAVGAREGAEGLFHSLQRLLELPDGFRVFPGHLAGSLCGAELSTDPSSTIGAERRFNPALALATVEQFAEEAAFVSAPRPPNMERIVELNRGPFLGSPPPLEPAAADGATVLDVREPESFAAGHVPGALNVPLEGSGFGTKAGFVLRRGERVVLHAASREQAELAGRRLRAVGFLEVEGYLDEPDATGTLEPLDVTELEHLLATNGGVELLDVRELAERDGAFIVGSRNIPYRLLRSCVDAGDFEPDRPVVTICETGARAAIAASILAGHGLAARPVLGGGIPDWQRRGGATIEFRRCGSH